MHRRSSKVTRANASVSCDQYWCFNVHKDFAFTDQVMNVVGVGDLDGAEGFSVTLMTKFVVKSLDVPSVSAW